jgi:hypothetical protein
MRREIVAGERRWCPRKQFSVGLSPASTVQLCLGADMRFVTPDAKLSVMEIKWGLSPDMAGAVLMRGLVRDDGARADLFRAHLQWSGSLGAGLATRVCDDPRGEALAFAKEVAAKSPDAIARPSEHPAGESLRPCGTFVRIFQETLRSSYRLGKDMRDRKDNRLCFHDKSGVLSARVVWSQFPTSTSAAGLPSSTPFSFTVIGAAARDDAAFSAGTGSEL